MPRWLRLDFKPSARLFPKSDQRVFADFSRNSDQTCAMVRKNAEWLKTTFPLPPALIEEYLRKDFFFRQGQDLEGRPVLMFWGSKLGTVPTQDVDKAVASMLHVLETTMREMTAANQDTPSQFVCIVFIDYGSVLNRELIKRALAEWQANYPYTLHRALICPGTPLAQTLWAVFKWLLYAETREKVVIVGEDKVFQQYVHADFLPKCFGGKVERVGPSALVCENRPPTEGAAKEAEAAALREVQNEPETKRES